MITLTPEQIRAMQAGREMNAELARFMGWHEAVSVDWSGPYPKFVIWELWESGVEIYEDDDITRHRVWSPSTRIADAFEVQAEIERRGLGEQYGAALAEIVIGWRYKASKITSDAEFFALANASPVDRCKAALIVMAGRQGG